MPSEEQISQVVHEILRTNDLQTITLRMVMNMLCERFSLPKEHLTPQKPFVRNIINEFLANSYTPDPNEQVQGTAGAKKEEEEEDQDDEDDDDEEQQQQASKKRKRSTPASKKKAARPRSTNVNPNKEIKLTGLERAVVLAEPLVEFFGDRVIARSHIPKRISTYAKQNNLQDPNDGRRILCDESLKKALNVDTFTFFSLPKLISALVSKPDERDEEIQQIAKECEAKLIEEKRKKLQDFANSVDNLSSGANTTATKRQRKKPRSNLDEDGKPKKPTGFSKPMQLSEALIAVVGDTQLPRSEVLKKLWHYIRENNLKDPNNTKQVICDDKLKAVFDGNDFIGNMAILKHIGAHMTRIEES